MSVVDSVAGALVSTVAGVTRRLGVRDLDEAEATVEHRREKRIIANVVCTLLNNCPQSTAAATTTTTTTSSSAKPTTTTSTTSKAATTTSSTTKSTSTSKTSSTSKAVSSTVVVSSSIKTTALSSMTPGSSVASSTVVTASATSSVVPLPSSTITCLDSSVNDTVITSLFYYGGANTVINLCASAQISLTNAVFFWGTGQTLQTVGLPTGSTRATLTVTGQNQTCAIYGAQAGNDYATLQNVIINGNRPAMGIYASGLASIELGGNNAGHKVTNIWSYEPRAWSAMHMIEGTNLACSASTVTNSQFGPCGHAPSGADQFRRMKRMTRQSKRDTGTYSPGEWADGISMACQGSTVSGNTITDATDGAIVVFGAPGSSITGNHIIAESRNLLGALNGVDFGPFNGEYTGTVVSGNTVDARNAMIKTGIALGPLAWGVYQQYSSDYFNYDGTWTGNTFTTTGANGYFNFGIAISGHKNPTVLKNNFVNANFGGVQSSSCLYGTPNVQPLILSAPTVSGQTVQSDFVVQSAGWELAICYAPGPLNITSYSHTA